MKIRKIEISGFRSFGPFDPVVFHVQNKCLLLGPNNSGKSNLYKYLENVRSSFNSRSLKEANSKLSEWYSKRVFSRNDYWANGTGTIIAKFDIEVRAGFFGEAFLTGVNLVQKESILKILETNWRAQNDTLRFRIILHHVYEPVSKNEFQIEFEDEIKRVELVLGGREGSSEIEFKENRIASIRLIQFDSFSSDQQKSIARNLKETFNLKLLPALKARILHELANSLLFFEAIRDWREDQYYNKNVSPISINGRDIHRDLKVISDDTKNRQVEWSELKSKIETYVSRLLDEPLVQFELTSHEIRFVFNRGGKEFRAHLDRLGTGVAQIVILLCYLLMNRHSDLIVFLEEPENNLHSGAISRIFDILEEDFSNHQFIITSHSSSLMDKVKADWSIYSVQRTYENPTKVYQCGNLAKQFQVLDNLGIRPSQILQSNCVIWVEGPTDRIYIRNWINQFFPDEFLENKHYSFLFYGGAVGDYLGVHDTDRDIEIIRSSRYAYVVSDKDDSDVDEPKIIKKIVQKIDELKRKNEDDFSKFVGTWSTWGRDIENYFSKEFWNFIFSKDHLDLGQNSYLDGSKSISLEKAEILREVGEKEEFEKYLINHYSVDGNEISDDELFKKIRRNLSGLKADIAEVAEKHWRPEFIRPGTDLEERINELAAFIRTANGLDPS